MRLGMCYCDWICFLVL